MVGALRRRGPDDQGLWSDLRNQVALGHARLSIIDLSVAGHQPMTSADGRCTIVFNGEIYNYKELRVELEAKGHRFVSHSDTEVILEAYAEWGAEAVRLFRGMFAFALFDNAPTRNAPSLVLARDRMGIKPLVYAEQGDSLVFASELRALLASGLVSKQVDKEAVLDFLAVGAVFQPRTMLASVKSLPPACWMEVRGSEHRIVQYWDLQQATVTLRKELSQISFEEAVPLVRKALLEAARYNMVADVPVGAFLSGGIDSTAAVGLMGEASGQRIKTFSIGFEQAHRKMDERGFARLAADHLGSEHQEIVVTAAEAADVFPAVVDAIDQPSLDGINTWLVSRAACGSVKVAVSGLGGDELFAGYPHFQAISEAARRLPAGMPGLDALLGHMHRIRPNRFTFHWLLSCAPPARRLAMLRRLLNDQALYRNVLPLWARDAAQRLENIQKRFLLEGTDTVQQTTYAELGGYLLSTLLRDGDVMSMAHGLEVRPFLLDHPLAELVYALPAHVKVRSEMNKALLVMAAEQYLPAALKNRPKMGFEMPFGGWMAGPLHDRIRVLLESENAAALFQKHYLAKLQAQLAQGQPPYQLWAWSVLLAWCELQGVSLE
jgi:asparagine synthase (glutamine-hydrolysing)